MSVKSHGGVVILEGSCSAEDAEALLIALQDAPGAVVDVAGAVKLHLAVVQVLLSLRPQIRGAGDAPSRVGKIVESTQLDSDITSLIA